MATLTPTTCRVDIVEDRPPPGSMWHCGPNAVWVTATHLPTRTSVRVYGASMHKTREAAMACLEMLVDQFGAEAPMFPERIGKREE